MVRYKQTHEILKLISDRKHIRNIGFIAHIDHGKCVSGDTFVFLGDGRLVRIDELYQNYDADGYGNFNVELYIPSFNPETKVVENVYSSHIWRLRKDRMVRIRLRNGFEVKVTPEHPFFTIDGAGVLRSVRADKIKVGDYIMVPRRISVDGWSFREFKEYAMKRILDQEGFYIYFDTYFRDILYMKLKRLSFSKVHDGGVGSSYKAIERSIRKGRYRSSDLKKIVDILSLDYQLVYDHIEYIGYKGNIGRYGGRLSRFSLPKNDEEFKAALYAIGLLYGDGSTSCSFSALNDEMITLFKESLHKGFKIGTYITRQRTTNRVMHRGGKAFIKFITGIFSYPIRRKATSLTMPEIIMRLRNQYISEFIKGVFDTDGVVEKSRSAISLTSASKEYIIKLSYILQRFGILPILRRKGRYMILYVSGEDVKIFAKYIGFNNQEKRNKLLKLVEKTGKGRVGEYIPLNPYEIRNMRMCIGFSQSEIPISYYGVYESGKEAITRNVLKNIVNVFKNNLENKNILKRYNALNKINNKELIVNRNEREILKTLINDELVEKIKDNYKLTSLGRDILNIWYKRINNVDGVNLSINSILNQWESILNGDIRFIRVSKVEFIEGDFDVYDLTIPKNHTFIANGVIVHNTTLSDSLLAASGLLSPSVAGEARALDYLEEEQKRGITIKTANISLLHEYDGKEYVINLIDTPGHVDFTGKVTRALRAIDGAVVIVDAVEEVMVQTETVTRQALEERVKPLLFINKVDRLINELRLGPSEIQVKLGRVIQRFNQLIDIFGEKGFKDKWRVRPDLNNVAFGSAKDKWGFTLRQAQEKGMTFNDVLKFYSEGKLDELRELFPVHKAVLDMVVEHIPTPIEAQRYRIPKIWHGDLDSEIGQAMLNCDENGPVAFMVTNITVDERAGLVATGRLLSGTLKSGLEVYLIGKRKKDRVLQVGMYMGPYREVVDYMIAGNIPAVLGLEAASAGETVSTISSMLPFEAIHYISEPVVTISIEPKNTRDLPKLINSLRKLAIEDPNLHVKINEETGEYLLSGMGTLHLEVSLHFLADMGIEVSVSSPIVVYRETITRRSPVFPGKSPNKHNKVKVRLEKLDDEVVDMIVSGELNERLGRKEIQRILMEKGWSADEARSVWVVDNEGGNILIDMTKGVQYMQESKQMLIGAFLDFCKEGVLAREPLRGVKGILIDAFFHEDPAHRTLAQIIPMLHRALLGAELTANPSLYEPIMKMQVQVPTELIGAVTGVIASKRGQVTNIDQREYYSVVNGFIPVSETFDLAQILRGATAGRAFWQTQFSHWQLIPKSILTSVVSEIRRRKGLPENPPSYRDFIPPGEQIEK